MGKSTVLSDYIKMWYLDPWCFHKIRYRNLHFGTFLLLGIHLLTWFIDSARTVCGRIHVRLSVSRIDRCSCSSMRRVCWCGPGGQEMSIDSGGRHVSSSTAFSSKCEQCHLVSWRRKLNTDLFILSLRKVAMCYGLDVKISKLMLFQRKEKLTLFTVNLPGLWKE